jgi:DNA polymerase I-like protein with 3'-5' exonuclease and polymerase domains
MNRAMLLTTRKLKEHGIDGHVVLTIHDEQIVEVREDQAEKAAEIIKWSMENAVDLSPIKLKATPIIGNSYGECK